MSGELGVWSLLGDEAGDEDFPDPLLRNAVEEQFAVSLSVRCVW